MKKAASCDIKDTRSRQIRFLPLLASLLALMMLEPFMFEYTRLKFMLDIFFTLILFTSIYAVSEQRSTLFIAVLLALPKLGTTWALKFAGDPLLSLLDSFFGIIFLTYIIVLILRHIFRQKDVTQETIYGAIVVYILLGTMWVFLYLITESIHPQSFSISLHPADISQKTLYYYSFVTLTTLGFGDITPISGPARSLTTLESIVGQMYIAVLIARLVGTHISQGMLKR